MSIQSITALILAGGAGSRMGNIDKGLYELNGKALIDRVIERLAAQSERLIISCNRNIEQYRQRGYLVIEDSHYQNQVAQVTIHNKHSKPNQGPLAGVVSAIQHIETDYLMLCPCDTPYIPSDIVDRLYRAMVDQRADVAVANSANRRQNLHCLISVKQLPSLATFYANGSRAIKDWLTTTHVVDVDFSDAAAFENLNRVNLNSNSSSK